MDLLTAAPMGPTATLSRQRRSAVTASVLLVLTLTLWFLHWHGLDYPAQVYRAGLIRRHGFSLWDANWYGGHYTPAYGVIVPWLGSTVGLAVPAVLSTLGSVVLFERLLLDARAPHVTTGTAAFAFLMLVNMYEGRLPFACGVLLGLLAVTLARGDRWRFAAGAALLTTLASPVAGAFVALAFGAWALSALPDEGLKIWRTPPFAVSVLAMICTVVIGLTFPEGGYFPYNLADVFIAVAAGALVWWMLPSSLSAVRWGFLLAGVMAIPLFIIPNPMGGNLARLAVLGAPLLCALQPRHRLVHAAICLTLLGQQMVPLLRLPEAVQDPSSQPSYFHPLIAELEARTTGPVRVEIPMTESHWEAAYFARAFPLARGWERQLDLRYNALLYDPTMTSAQYHDWLLDNGVRYVAIPDTKLEQEADHEVDVARQASYLRQMWSNRHWQLYQVVDSPGLLTGPAKVTRMTAGVVRLNVFQTDLLLLRMRYTSRLAVAHGQACISRSVSGWTQLQPLTTGPLTLRMSLFPTSADGCPS